VEILRLLLVCWSFAALALPSLAAGGSAAKEYEVKAAFLLNFIRYATWPAEAFDRSSSPTVIVVFGHDPFGGALDRLAAGRTEGGRPIVVRKTHKAADLRGAHMVFVSARSAADLSTVLQAVRGGGTLIVGESRQFAQDGGTINFFIEDSRIRFEVNLTALRATRVSLSSQLLNLARIIR
jgi:hypothetical protein